MQLKKFLIIFWAVTLILSATLLGASAEGTEIFEVEVQITGTSTFSSPSFVNRGDEVSVNVVATQNTGVSSIYLYISFDANVFEVVEDSLVSGHYFGTDSSGNPVESYSIGENYVCLRLITLSATASPRDPGSLCTFSLKAKTDACEETTISARLRNNDPSWCVGNGKIVPFNVIPATLSVHEVDATSGVVTAPSCFTDGYTTYTCADCAEPVVGNIIPAPGAHTPGAAATCTADQLCTVCNEVLTTATGHNAGAEATCTKPQVCTLCNTTLTPANGHVAGPAATCTSVQACTVCNVVLVGALPHTEVADEAVAATCTATGLTAGKHCSVCSAVLAAQVETPALGHDFGDWVVTVEPTEEAKGEKYHECATCGTVETTVIAELSHDHTRWEAIVLPAVDPTCTTPGKTEGKQCAECNEIFVEQVVVPATGHTYESAVTAPTCTAAGYTTYTCACGHSYRDAYVDALGHTYTAVVTAPTCTAEGYTTNTCTCGHSLVSDKVSALGHTNGDAATCTTNQICTVCNVELVAALGHTEVVLPAVAPSCTATGLTEGEKCSVCEEILTAQETVATVAHNEVVIPAVAATCSATGLTEGKLCLTCLTELVAQETVAKLAHTAGAEATCTTAQVCTVCNEELTAALGHTAGAEATCTTAQVCTVCNAELTAALGHTAGAAATCTTAQVCTVCNAELASALGHTAGAEATCTTAQVCTVCNAELASALGHTAGAAATCTTAQVCTVCNEELTAALGHTEVIDAAVAATCTATGLTEGKHCSVCETVLVAQETVDALGHDFGDWEVTVEPTETAKGEKSRECATCETVETAEVAELSHDHTRWEAIVLPAVAPTCTESGLTEGQKCSECGEVTVAQTVVPATGHTYVPTVTAPTCTAAGYTTYTCACGQSYRDAYVDATGHDYDAVVTAPTCVDKGYTTYTCACGKSYVADEVSALGHTAGAAATCTTNQICTVCNVELVAALGHTEAVLSAVAPTCTESGLTEGKKCSVCEAVLLAQETVAALGHTAGAAATCTTAQICTVCNAELAAALGHTEAVLPEVAPTCTESGLTEGKKCSVCETVLVAQETVAALGHTEEKISAVDPTTSTPGKTEGTKCAVCGEILVAQEEVETLAPETTAPVETTEEVPTAEGGCGGTIGGVAAMLTALLLAPAALLLKKRED